VRMVSRRSAAAISFRSDSEVAAFRSLFFGAFISECPRCIDEMGEPDIEITDPDGDYRIISTPRGDYGYELVYGDHRFPFMAKEIGRIINLLDDFVTQRSDIEVEEEPKGVFGAMTNVNGEKRPYFATDSGHRSPTREEDIPHLRNLFNDLAEQIQITTTA